MKTVKRIFRTIRNNIFDAWHSAQEGKVVEVAIKDAMPFKWPRNRRYPEAMLRGQYEVELIDTLSRLLKPGDCFFDVGANSGYVSLCAKGFVGNGAVFSFEPLPENIAMMRKVQALNPELAFTIVEAAVAAEDGTVCLEVTNNNANSRISGVRWELSKPAVARLSVRSVQLKRYLQQYHPTLIKIDTEGAESAILASLAPADDWGSRPTFLVECHGDGNFGLCAKQLEEWDYRLFSLGGPPISNLQPEQFILAKPSACGCQPVSSFGAS